MFGFDFRYRTRRDAEFFSHNLFDPTSGTEPHLRGEEKQENSRRRNRSVTAGHAKAWTPNIPVRYPRFSVSPSLRNCAPSHGTITRRRERSIENVAGSWPMSSPSTCSGVGKGLVSVSDSVWKIEATDAGNLPLRSNPGQQRARVS